MKIISEYRICSKDGEVNVSLDYKILGVVFRDSYFYAHIMCDTNQLSEKRLYFYIFDVCEDIEERISRCTYVGFVNTGNGIYHVFCDEAQ
jgi:hypothetical protein